jgi:Putative DNA-binding domain
MSRLLQQQQALLHALFEWPAQDATKNIAAHAYYTGARGLKAYQSNGHSLAQRVLEAAYPVVAQLVGAESFADLARALWHAHPPTRGDMAQWGDALPEFLQASTQLADEPYLSDVARTEWALHCAASAADAFADVSTLALLTTHDPAQLYFGLAPGGIVVRSAWPIVSILGAHLEHTPAFAVVGQQLRDGLAQDALVWRAGLRPRVREAFAGEAHFVQALAQGLSVSQALDAAPVLDFGAWLPMAVQSGLLLRVQSHI